MNVLDGARSGTPGDASAAKFLNLHLGARQPEPGKKKLFFANVWAHRLHEAERRGIGLRGLVRAATCS